MNDFFCIFISNLQNKLLMENFTFYVLLCLRKKSQFRKNLQYWKKKQRNCGKGIFNYNFKRKGTTDVTQRILQSLYENDLGDHQPTSVFFHSGTYSWKKNIFKSISN